MFKKIKTIWRGVKAQRQALREGLSPEEARERMVASIVEDTIGSKYPGAVGGSVLADIPPDARRFFEEESYRFLYDEKESEAFRLTARHVKLIRDAAYYWDGAESGAPRMDPDAPLTENPLAVLGETFQTEDTVCQARHFVGLTKALNAYFHTVEIEAGTYALDEHMVKWITEGMVGYGGIKSRADMGLTEKGEAILTRDNIRVLQNTWWGFNTGSMEYENRWPGPEINAKRPYGNFTNWPIEMAVILGWLPEEFDEDEDEDEDEGEYPLTDAQENELQRIHFRLFASVLAVLKHGKVTLPEGGDPV